MQTKFKLSLIALCFSSFAMAQNVETTESQKTNGLDESAFTFTEAQLGEDDDMSQNVTIMNSGTNIYASEVGFQFSPVRFRYRAFNQKYNDIYINGAPMNDMESGQFRYSLVGGLNQQTRNSDFALPFESNNFSMPAMAGSNNYNFRAGSMAAGHRATVTMANRNYTLRGMYTYASGFNAKGWAIAANLTYRWANRGYVEGTFYNALSYFLAVQKKWENGHSLSISTWGNPTERASQGAATDEVYWLANNRYYNPYWGYQNGHVRNSRVINDFAPSAIATWDWQIDNNSKLVTSLFGKYSMYKSTRLGYNGPDNPQPNYWKNLPSSYFDVWDPTDAAYRTEDAFGQWQYAYDYWTASKANRQLNWDRLYYANKQAALLGIDAPYYLEAKHNNNLTLNLSSTLTKQFGDKRTWNVGFQLGQNIGNHYKSMEDLLGASYIHNVNTYALGNFDITNPAVQYDLNTAGPNGLGKVIYKGDRFGYDYDLRVQKGLLWTNYSATTGHWHLMAAAKLGATQMNRKGNMRNGLFANNSFGKSQNARFGEGGAKGSATFDAGHGHTFTIGAGYEWRPPMASTAFVSPEMNNDFVANLKDEHVFSSDFGYQYNGAGFHLNLNAYYSRLDHVTEWQNFYFDDANSFTYVSMTGIKKEYYGVELGANVRLTSFLDLKMLGTWGDAKNLNNAHVRYMLSTSAEYVDDVVMNKGMREASTPLTAASAGLSYHQKGWFIDLDLNYYDRIYLSYSPSFRYQSTLRTMNAATQDLYIDPVTGQFRNIPEQSKGHGGFMLDGSIGKNVRLKKGSLSINFMVTNILNNRSIVTGGYEQSRSDYTTKADGSLNNVRAYKFSQNPMKYYAMGTNGMLNIAYKF